MKRQFTFKWESELSIQVQPMDKDHQVLIDMMNSIYKNYTQNAQRSEISKGMQELGDFVIEHFAREERFFDTIPNYPDGQVHKGIHKKLVNRYLQYLNDYKAGAELTDDFFYFLKAWLVAHIQGVDMKYGELVSAA